MGGSMESKSQKRKWRLRAALSATLAALIAFPIPASSQNRNDGGGGDHRHRTETPIKHVIVLIGENRTFDHVFATYVPRSEDSVRNLLSEHIINADGTLGRNSGKAEQFQATPPFLTKSFISLDGNDKAAYQTLPDPTLNFVPTKTTFP